MRNIQAYTCLHHARYSYMGEYIRYVTNVDRLPKNHDVICMAINGEYDFILRIVNCPAQSSRCEMPKIIYLKKNL